MTQSQIANRKSKMGLWYGFWRWVCRCYFRFYHKLACFNPDRVPAQGAFILAPNHMSYLDPPLVGVCCPRELNYVARKSLFRFWYSNLILRSVNVLPVDLEGSSLSAFKTVLRLLEQGKPVVIFPEGTRSEDGRLLEAEAGVGWLALKSGVPVVPVRVWGTQVAMPRRGKGRRARLEVKFGEPLHFDPKSLPKDRKAASVEIARQIMAAIGSLEPFSDKGGT